MRLTSALPAQLIAQLRAYRRRQDAERLALREPWGDWAGVREARVDTHVTAAH